MSDFYDDFFDRAGRREMAAEIEHELARAAWARNGVDLAMQMVADSRHEERASALTEAAEALGIFVAEDLLTEDDVRELLGWACHWASSGRRVRHDENGTVLDVDGNPWQVLPAEVVRSAIADGLASGRRRTDA